jgi:hypothetical protein
MRTSLLAWSFVEKSRTLLLRMPFCRQAIYFKGYTFIYWRVDDSYTIASCGSLVGFFRTDISWIRLDFSQSTISFYRMLCIISRTRISGSLQGILCSRAARGGICKHLLFATHSPVHCHFRSIPLLDFPVLQPTMTRRDHDWTLDSIPEILREETLRSIEVTRHKRTRQRRHSF